MSEYNKTILTNEGIDLARRANKGTAIFSLTRGVSSTDDLSDKTIEELQNLSQLPSIQQSVVLSNVENTSDNPDTVLGVRMTFDNQNLRTGYNVHTVGIYAKEPGKNEILYGIATAKTPEYIPDFNEQTLFKFDFLMYLVIGRTDKVTVEVSPDDVYRKRDTYSKTEIDDKFSKAVSQLNQKDVDIIKILTAKVDKSYVDNELSKRDTSFQQYKKDNQEYHRSLEQSLDSKYVKPADIGGGVNLLPNTYTLQGYSGGENVDGFRIFPRANSSDNTAKIQMFARSLKNFKLKMPQIRLDAGTYTLSFTATISWGGNSVIGFPEVKIGLFSSTYHTGKDSLGTAVNVNGFLTANNCQITFTLSAPYNLNNLCLQYCGSDDHFSNDVYLYFKNLKLEKGPVATPWCPSYIDYQNLADDITAIKTKLNM